MKLQSGKTLGAQVLEALGIDSRGVTVVEISMQANAPATVTVTRGIYDKEARQMVDHLSQYELKQLDEAPAASE